MYMLCMKQHISPRANKNAYVIPAKNAIAELSSTALRQYTLFVICIKKCNQAFSQTQNIQSLNHSIFPSLNHSIIQSFNYSIIQLAFSTIPHTCSGTPGLHRARPSDAHTHPDLRRTIPHYLRALGQWRVVDD